MGLLITSDVPENAATAVAVDTEIAPDGTFVAKAIPAATVRVLRFAACAAAATVVMAEAVVMVQVVAAARSALATVNVTTLLVLSTAAVKVLVPHPWSVGAVPEASVHTGSATTIVSLVARGAEHWNVSTTALAAPAMGLLITSDVPENAATVVALDVVIARAVGFAVACRLAAMVRVARFTA